MAFRVKNISPFIQTLFGSQFLAYEVKDLLEITSAANVKASILSGELFSKIMGRMFSLAVPQNDFGQIGLSDSEYYYLVSAGFFQGHTTNDDLKFPTKISPDGYTTTSSILTSAAKGTSVSAGITSRSTGPNSQALDVYDLSPSCIPGNYSTSRGDASAVRASDTTVTFTGPTIVSTQIRRVIAFISASVQPLIWEQGINSAISYSAGTITVYAVDGNTAPIPATTTLVVVDWVAQDKGYDQSLQAIRTAPQYSDRSYRQTDPVSIIAAAQNLTASWADLGPEILCDGSNTVCLWVNVDINTSVNVRFRALAKHTSAGAVEYMLPTKVVNSSASPWLVQVEGNQLEWNVDGTDFATVFSFALDNAVRYVQFQVMHESASGTVGQVLNAEITQAY